MSKLKITVPPEIHTDIKACGEFIVDINERIAQLQAVEKALKEAKETACNVMLDRLNATGQVHFAFDFGTFSQTKRTNVSFPTAEDGGRDKAAEWLQELLDRKVIDFKDVLNVQQSRVSVENVLAIEELAKEYNDNFSLIDPNFEPVPESPFNHFEQFTLSTPRKRK